MLQEKSHSFMPQEAVHTPLDAALHTTADLDILEMLDTGFQL